MEPQSQGGPIQVLAAFFFSPEEHVEWHRTQKSQDSLDKEKVEGFPLLDFRIYCKETHEQCGAGTRINIQSLE